MNGSSTLPAVEFAAPPAGGVRAEGEATLDYGVDRVRLTNRGRGYTVAPSVTFSSGSAAAVATLRGPRGNTEYDNVYWARQTLYGKQLRIWLNEPMDEEPAAEE